MPSAAPGGGSAAVIAMVLTMRPTGLGHGVYKDIRRLRHLLRRVVYRPHLRNSDRPQGAALVLGATRA